jgi:hypothetical protein
LSSHVTRYQPDGDKIMRLQAQMAIIENGFDRDSQPLRAPCYKVSYRVE